MSIFGKLILEDANPITSANSAAIVLYQHLVKWKYQPALRCSSWCNSIVDNARAIYKFCYDKKEDKIKVYIM